MGSEQANHDDRLRQTLALIAPGQQLRDGLERILRGRTGALIVFERDMGLKSFAETGVRLDAVVTYEADGVTVGCAICSSRARRPATMSASASGTMQTASA